MTEIHITNPQPFEDDLAVEKSLRPSRMDEFIGQKDVINNLKIYIEAAKKRNEALDHVLLFGPPGLGKTTLSNIVAYELGVNLKQTSGPVLERAGDLAGVLTNLLNQDVFFVDEIHRLNSVVEEYLYSAMEDYRIEIMIDKGPGARSVQLNIEPFTLVGATTRLGNLTSPLRDRFGIVLRVDYYNPEDLFQIITRSAEILEVVISKEGAHELAKRSRGTPRIANRILRRTRDYAQVKAKGTIDKTVVQASLEYLGIDEFGLDDMDRTILSTLIDKFNGGPVGVNSLAVAVSEDTSTIEDVYEPYLIKEGFIQRTSRGRIAQKQAYTLPEYLKRNDLVILNNTKVFPARLYASKDRTEAKVEVFLLRELENDLWEVMVRPARKVRIGNKLMFTKNVYCDVIDNTISGGRVVRFEYDGENIYNVIDRVGISPLPPYIKRESEPKDKIRYQTVFAEKREAVAAPTAGLHFTDGLLKRIHAKGAKTSYTTLHIGLGTFRPVQVEDLNRHQMDSEYFEVSPKTALSINATKEKRRRVFAVGTSTVRSLETVAVSGFQVSPKRGWTDKFIYPPYNFKMVDAMITNFHQPKSTLLMMVSAFADRDQIMKAYREAKKNDYRFLSYGDAMLIL